MPGADPQLQAPPPAQSNLSDLAVSGATGSNGRSEDEQETVYVRGSNEEQPGEHLGEQALEDTGNPGEQMIEIDRGSKNVNTEEQSTLKRGSSNERMGDSASAGEDMVDAPASQWLKTLLPEGSGGWWDVYPKDNGFAVRFRWRDQGRQTLTFPQISYQHLQELKQSSPDETGMKINERITDSLRKYLLDPEKRNKAMLVARKLGIDLDDSQ